MARGFLLSTCRYLPLITLRCAVVRRCLTDVRLGFTVVAPGEPRCPTGNAQNEHGEAERKPPLPRDEPAAGAQHAQDQHGKEEVDAEQRQQTADPVVEVSGHNRGLSLEPPHASRQGIPGTALRRYSWVVPTPAWSVLMAAFISRSCADPQSAHCHCLTDKPA